MTDAERLELAFLVADLKTALNGVRAHNANVRREREMLPAHLVVAMGNALGRAETLMGKPTEPPKKKAYSRMSG